MTHDQNVPRYRNITPEQVRTTFTGKDDGFDQVFDLDDDVVLIVRGTAKKGSFKVDQFGVGYLQQQIKVSHAVIPDEDTIDEALAEIKRREDEAAGQESLDEEIDADLDVVDGGEG